jgi:hypothetical protein
LRTSTLQNLRTSRLQNFRTSELQNFGTFELMRCCRSTLHSFPFPYERRRAYVQRTYVLTFARDLHRASLKNDSMAGSRLVRSQRPPPFSRTFRRHPSTKTILRTRGAQNSSASSIVVSRRPPSTSWKVCAGWEPLARSALSSPIICAGWEPQSARAGGEILLFSESQ